MALIETLILLAIIVFILYKLATKNNDFFKKRNVPYIEPTPFVGNLGQAFLRKTTGFELLIDYHIKFKSKIYGLFNMTVPQITIKDTDLIKQLFVKDFDYFVNHYSIISFEDDPLFGAGLITLKDQKWKDMRTTLSPAFTGSKLRFMFELIRECSQGAVDYVKTEIQNKTNTEEFEIDGKDFFTRYTHNVIASTAFGLKVNSYKDFNNEFFKKSKKAVGFGFWVFLRIMFYSYCKPVAKFLKVPLFDTEFKNYFIRLVMDTMSFRLKNNIVRPDMIHLLLEARKTAQEYEKNSHKNENSNDSSNVKNSLPISSHIRNWSDEELVAQCFLFFLAGFETSSNLMCFAALELIENPEIQNRLYDEINDVLETAKNNGKPVTFDNIQGMKYLDMVISETLRKWPPAPLTDRVCSKPYVLKYDDNELKLNTGDLIWINIVGLHHDPENFERPMVFDPERFSDENKANIKPFTYMPFGVGPRACIGLRFALIQAKVILFNLLSNFKIEASEKTVLPIVLDRKSFILQPKGGFNYKLKLRS